MSTPSPFEDERRRARDLIRGNDDAAHQLGPMPESLALPQGSLEGSTG